MKYLLLLLPILLLFFPNTEINAQDNIGMTNEIMGRILKSEATSIEGQLGNWQVLSIFEGFVISVFTHPLRELTRDQFVDAMGQVVNLAQNFGTTYSSTSLIFGGGENEEQNPEEKKKEDRINKKPGQGKS